MVQRSPVGKVDSASNTPIYRLFETLKHCLGPRGQGVPQRPKLRFICLGVAAIALASCTTPNIHKTDQFPGIDGVQTLAVDAKQRVVLVTTKTQESGQTKKTISVTCAEPSPDALSALSSSVSGGASYQQIAANLAVSQAESAASIGLRTQSIQLLRDGMFRLCEGYAAGALTQEQFNRQQRRYQNLMLSLLAIEQLTGAVAAGQATLGEGSASASAGDRADEAAANLSKANAAAGDAQTSLKKAQDAQAADAKTCAADSTSASCNNAATNDTAVKGAQSKLDEAQQDQKTAQGALSAARSAVKAEAAGAKVTVGQPTIQKNISDNSAQYIAEATRTIVATTLLASFAQEECADLWDFAKELASGLPAPAKAAVFGLTESGARNPSAPTFAVNDGPESEFVHLVKNCQSNEKRIFGESRVFLPSYGAIPSGPLQVLGASGGITLAPDTGPIKLFVAGGLPSYRVNAPPTALLKEISWTLDKDQGNYVLTLVRPKGASGEAKASAFVLDANNSAVEVPIILQKVSDKK